jgi:hypothetical protein
MAWLSAEGRPRPVYREHTACVGLQTEHILCIIISVTVQLRYRYVSIYRCNLALGSSSEVWQVFPAALCTNYSTKSMEQSLEKLVAPNLIKKFTAFYCNRRFVVLSEYRYHHRRLQPVALQSQQAPQNIYFRSLPKKCPQLKGQLSCR